MAEWQPRGHPRALPGSVEPRGTKETKGTKEARESEEAREGKGNRGSKRNNENHRNHENHENPRNNRTSRSGSSARVTGTVRSLGRSLGRALHFPLTGPARGIRKATHAHGAGESGLGKLIELHGVNGAGDVMITIALASTVFFSVPTDEARGRVALYLAITMAPFTLLAPVIGPLLDRIPARPPRRHGRGHARPGPARPDPVRGRRHRQHRAVSGRTRRARRLQGVRGRQKRRGAAAAAAPVLPREGQLARHARRAARHRGRRAGRDLVAGPRAQMAAVRRLRDLRCRDGSCPSRCRTRSTRPKARPWRCSRRTASTCTDRTAAKR